MKYLLKLGEMCRYRHSLQQGKHIKYQINTVDAKGIVFNPLCCCVLPMRKKNNMANNTVNILAEFEETVVPSEYL